MNRIKPQAAPGRKVPEKGLWPRKRKFGPYAMKIKRGRSRNATKKGPGRIPVQRWSAGRKRNNRKILKRCG